jgi:hypothetical protein
VQRISTSCLGVTFHFFCRLLNMVQREEKNQLLHLYLNC